jgi:carbon storage regulator
MLVLSRQKNESIMIGDDIEIVIADICGNKVKIGITAPQQVSVHRNEIWKAIQRDKNKF